MKAADDSSIAGRLFGLAWPIIGLNVLSVLALAIDTAMCGHLPNSEIVLTALGFATQVVFLLMVAMMGLTVGTVALVARAFGARNIDRVNHLLIQSSQLTVILSLTVAVLGNIFAGPILTLLGASEPVADAGLLYLRPLLTGTVFYYLNILYGGVLRGVGNTRLPFTIALGSTAINVFLNYGLILGNMGFPALGLRGAAIGTVVSYAFGVTAMVIFIRRGAIEDLTIPLQVEPIDRALSTDLFRVGAPAAMDMVILNAAFISLVSMIARVDEVAVAAHGIGLRVQALAFVPGMSVSQATGAMVGQALGAGDVRQAKQVLRASVLLSTAIMTTLAIAIVLFAEPVVGIFQVQDGTPLAEYSVLWIRLLGYGMPIVGVYIAFVGLLQGSGSTRVSLRINFLTTVLFQIPLSAALGFPAALGALGIWLAFPLAFVLKAVLGFAAYRSGSWAKTGQRV